MMSKPLALLLAGIAMAQQGPSIEDMLRDTSSTANSIQTPASVGAGPRPSSQVSDPYSSNSRSSSNSIKDAYSSKGSSGSNAAPEVSPSGSIGGLLGAMASASGSPASSKPDMFGRKPPSNPMGALFGGGGKKKGGKMSPIMNDLLKTVEARMPQNAKNAAKAGGGGSLNPAAISQESKMIVAGLVEAFMHKVHLLPGEKACLENNLATLTFDVVGAATDLAKGIKAIMKGKPGNDKAVRAHSQGTLVSAGLDGAMKLTSLVTMATSLLKNCVQGDALEMLKATGRHFINMQYVSHRLLVSGVDVAHRLSDGIIAYEKHDWHRFGADIGIAIRKILLSNATKGSRLPEGVPEQAIIEQTTAGLMSGFFVRGAGVEITDSAAPDVDIQLDLHRCIAGNHEFFKEIWLALWNLIAQLSVTVGDQKPGTNPFGSFSMENADGSQPKWMGELMIAMMQVPVALSRCNIGQESQQMLMEAIKSIKYLKVHFLFPKHIITADEATRRMAKAVSSWTNWDFKDFGRQIGKLLREFVLLMYPQGGQTYPQQYSVDADGRLRRQLVLKSTPMNKLRFAGQSFNSPVSVALIVGGVAFTMLIAMMAVRGLRLVNRNDFWESSLSDCEGASDVELAGNFIEVE